MALVAFQFHGLSPDMSPSRIGDVAVIRCQRTSVGKVPSAGHGGVRVAGHPFSMVFQRPTGVAGVAGAAQV